MNDDTMLDRINDIRDGVCAIRSIQVALAEQGGREAMANGLLYACTHLFEALDLISKELESED